MKRFRLIGVALLAVFALWVVAASAAQAETAPSFTISGTRLISGKTHNFDARKFGATPFELKTPELGVRISCTGLSTEQGVLLGSNPGNPGKDNEIAVFSGCKLAEGNGSPNCELAGASHGIGTETLPTNALKSDQVENIEGGAVGKKLYEEFFAAEAAAGFITLNFTGTGCTLFQVKVSGQAVAEARLDNVSEGSVELGQTPQERTSWLIKFPTTAITEVWLISGGVGVKRTTELLTAGLPSTLSGTSLLLLVSTKGVPEPNTLWSLLP